MIKNVLPPLKKMWRGDIDFSMNSISISIGIGVSTIISCMHDISVGPVGRLLSDLEASRWLSG